MKIIEKREVPALASLYLAQMGENPERLVEFVDTLEPGIPKEEKWVLMVSTQVGCAMGCRMCDAGSLGYQGNLSTREILDQIRCVRDNNPSLDWKSHPKIKVHFARMGEPSLNLEVLEAIRLLSEELPGEGVIASVSTVAPDTSIASSFFESLLRVKDRYFSNGRFQLQFSMHASREEERRRVIPVRTWDFPKIAAYGEDFVKPGDRKITLNFALGPGEKLDVHHLMALFSPEKFLIKITPVNPTDAARSSGMEHVWTEAPDSISSDAVRLKRMGFEVILSPSLPEEIRAETSCGQLWSGSLKEKAKAMAASEGKDRRSYISPDVLPQKAVRWSREIAAVSRRRFSLHVRHAALLVVDMQEFFTNPSSPAYLPSARVIVPRVARLIELFRRMNRPVLYTVHVSGAGEGLMEKWWKKKCERNSVWAQVTRALEPRPEEEIFFKSGYGAFSGTELDGFLYSHGIEELVLAGAMTHLCLESTARAAFDLGFQVFTALDAAADQSEEFHVASLKSMAGGFAAVASVEELERQGGMVSV